MKCPHCSVEFFEVTYRTSVNTPVTARLSDHFDDNNGIDPYINSTVCPNCLKPTFILHIEPSNLSSPILSRRIFPVGGNFSSVPVEVSFEITSDFNEANEVLPISAKASAALSRRCLQSVLSAHGYVGANLFRQVETILSEKDPKRVLPSAISENIDAVRNFGNFSAHPVTDFTSLQIIEVEPGEAEWCLELMQDLFEHYYVAPARAAERRALLSSKLASAGKPDMQK